MDEANRRLAGILAADVVGYSAMIGTDEPATLARVRALRADVVEPMAAAHGGRLFKITGDGFLAAFASAVQALRCAIAIQDALRGQPDALPLRIGVHQVKWWQRVMICWATASSSRRGWSRWPSLVASASPAASARTPRASWRWKSTISAHQR